MSHRGVPPPPPPLPMHPYHPPEPLPSASTADRFGAAEPRPPTPPFQRATHLEPPLPPPHPPPPPAAPPLTVSGTHVRHTLSTGTHTTSSNSWAVRGSHSTASSNLLPGHATMNVPGVSPPALLSSAHRPQQASPLAPVAPPEEACAIARAHKRRSAQKAQEENGSSVA